MGSLFGEGNVMAVQQKGANGLIAEYGACERLAELLEKSNLLIGSNSSHFAALRLSAEQRVGNELSSELIARARRQGVALGDYLFNNLWESPSALGLTISDRSVRESRVAVKHVGHNTNSGVPEDILIDITLRNGTHVHLPVSSKAYKGGTVSLGSKSSTAALGRLFTGQEKISKVEFARHFGTLGEEVTRVLKLFKDAADEFYSTNASREFLDEYERRKGTRKVNNPLRRKEVGDFFFEKHGFYSEHRFAGLFCEIFNSSFLKMRETAQDDSQFVKQLRFLFANPEVLALNAVAETSTSEVVVHSSLQNRAYKDLNSVLQPGLSMNLIQKNGSSILGVEVKRETTSCSALSLAMWKDATIQFKIHA